MLGLSFLASWCAAVGPIVSTTLEADSKMYEVSGQVQRPAHGQRRPKLVKGPHLIVMAVLRVLSNFVVGSWSEHDVATFNISIPTFSGGSNNLYYWTTPAAENNLPSYHWSVI
ncbi:hypothetical protein EV401DRAFT_2028372, partial [Pisolithus croceorrhizus]